MPDALDPASTLRRRALGSILQGAGVAVLVTVGLAGAALLLNWAFLLFAIGPLRALQDQAAAGGVGPFSYGFLVLLLGIAFPIGWLIAAQQYATRVALRQVYRNHRAEVVGLLSRAIEREAGDPTGTDLSRWADALQKVRGSAAQYPPVVQPLLRVVLKRARIDRLEDALLKGTGPIPDRLSGALGAYVEEELIGSGSRWLWLAFVLNAATMISILLAGKS